MSAFLSVAAANAAYLIADGAVFAQTTTTHKPALLSTRRKITTAKRALLAVTTMGAARLGDDIAGAICDYADLVGAAGALARLQDVADAFHAELGIVAGKGSVKVQVAAFVPGYGGVHRYFASDPISIESMIPGHVGNNPAWHVIEPKSVCGQGSVIVAERASAIGLAPKQDEDLETWVRRFGIMSMSLMRHDGAHDGETLEFSHFIGGHIDLATVTEDGIKIERLLTWPDEIGKKIDPWLRGVRAAAA